MCGRFALYASSDRLAEQFRLPLPFQIAPRYNIAPSQPVLAMRVLRGKLYELEQERLAAEKAKLKGKVEDANFGSQIRSYVLHPYQLVKDLRTGVETSNTTAVLDGEIDPFIEAWLKNNLQDAA